MHVYIHTYIQTDRQTYIHMYMNACISMYVHVCTHVVRVCMEWVVPAFKISNVVDCILSWPWQTIPTRGRETQNRSSTQRCVGMATSLMAFMTVIAFMNARCTSSLFVKVYNVRLCKCMYLMYDLCLIWHVLELTVYTEAQCLVCFVSVLCKLCMYTCLTWS